MPPVTSRERPRAPRERPNDVPERLRSVSGASPERPGSAPRRARALQGGPGASRGRIGVRFGCQIGHKRCIFRCFFEHSVIMLLIQQSPRFCISIRFFFFPSGVAVCAQHIQKLIRPTPCQCESYHPFRRPNCVLDNQLLSRLAFLAT